MTPNFASFDRPVNVTNDDVLSVAMYRDDLVVWQVVRNGILINWGDTNEYENIRRL